ncbi:sensor histidine kinase [uncultured Tyzzerella sp.]|uniref:cache domain-containing sensor histidine kinase n=1 Tax=uncultured Tyzzerella sp. TaxID=2321398 RepID=UPI002942BFED|nr:sensor histidine kinase [uncultured Tyzzerella sp.]
MKKRKNRWLSFNNYGIQKIIMLSFTFISIICLSIVGITFYLRYVTNIKSVISKNNDLLLEQVHININSYLDNMIDISKAIYDEIYIKNSLDNVNIDNEIQILHKVNNKKVVNIGLFSKYGEAVSLSDNISLKENIDVRDNEWFIDAIKNKDKFNFSVPHIQQCFEYKNNEHIWVISISKYVQIKKNGKMIDGVILVDINFNDIEKIMSKANLGEKGYVYLANNKGDIVYHPRQQLIYYNLIEENNKKNSLLEKGVYVEDYENYERIVNVKPLDAINWTMIGITPVINMKKEYINIGIFILSILLFAISLILILNMILSYKITMPIKELEKAVKNFENGNLDFKVNIEGFLEVTYLGEVINAMLDSIKNLIESVNREHYQKRKSELDALQAQINPHFLYNTLDSIVAMIENEKYKASIDMTISLAKLFRISLSKGENIIPIKDELEHIKNYLKIQSIRYKNKFSYKINCDEEIINCATIKLTIQPLVENAIYHGVSFLDEDGMIEINVYKNEENVNIDIIDNGLGMSKECCENMLKGKVEPKGGGSGIGIKNVNDRIKLYFGDNYGIEIFSEYDVGTTVRIVIPITQIK